MTLSSRIPDLRGSLWALRPPSRTASCRLRTASALTNHRQAGPDGCVAGRRQLGTERRSRLRRVTARRGPRSFAQPAPVTYSIDPQSARRRPGCVVQFRQYRCAGASRLLAQPVVSRPFRLVPRISKGSETPPGPTAIARRRQACGAIPTPLEEPRPGQTSLPRRGESRRPQSPLDSLSAHFFVKSYFESLDSLSRASRTA